MIGHIRAVSRAFVLVGGTVVALLGFACVTALRRRRLTLAERARWLHFWCRLGARIFGMRTQSSNSMPPRGLLIANHLSYLDILLISSMAPAVFISKIEVRSWPLFGLMARLGGSIFVDRKRLRQLPTVIAQTEAILRSGALVVLFPEATTTDGSVVLPFRPALFEAAVRTGAPVTASRLSYHREDGSFDYELCWWGEMEFLPHLVRALSQPRINAQVELGRQHAQSTSRKLLAMAMHAEVTALGHELNGQNAMPFHTCDPETALETSLK